MTKEEFLTATSNLQEFYNKKLNDTQLEFWYDELKKHEIDKYKRAIGQFIVSSKSFPALSEVLAKIRSLQELIEEKPIENAPKVKCSTCHGSGLVKYYKKEGSVAYEYLCSCYCDNGKRINLPVRKYEEVFYYRRPEPTEHDYSQINF